MIDLTVNNKRHNDDDNSMQPKNTKAKAVFLSNKSRLTQIILANVNPKLYTGLHQGAPKSFLHDLLLITHQRFKLIL